MRKIYLLFFILCSATVLSQSSRNTGVAVKGLVVDKESGEGIPSASIRFCNPEDSSLITGVATEVDGTFYIGNVVKREYIVIVSSVGYLNCYRKLNLKTVRKLSDMGKIELDYDVVQLKETVVTANLPKVEASGDSLLYNAKAYKVPAGSMLEDLIKKFPGAKVDENGTLTINGKTVTKVLIGGKEFFVSDLSVAMKNIPADMVDKIKFYDKKSDEARVTGIDDGNEEPVLDLSVKKDMSRGIVSNIDVAAGSNGRYNGKLNANRFKTDESYTLIGELRNVEGHWSYNNGTTKRSSVKGNFSVKKEKLEIGGDADYSYNGSNVGITSTSETFLSGNNNSFMNSVSHNKNSHHNFYVNLRLEWKPDTLTNIIFRPRFNFSHGQSRNNGLSATFNKNPYDYTDNPLENIMNDDLFNDDSRVNYTYSDSYNSDFVRGGGMELQLFRRLNNEGRSITFRSVGNFSDSDSRQFSRSNVNYFLFKSVLGADSVYYRNQFYKTPSNNREISASLMYVEPVAKKVYVKMKYEFKYKFNDSNRATYDLTPYIPSVDASELGFLPDYYGNPIDDLSKFAEYDNVINKGELSLQIDREKMNFNVGISLENINTTMDCDQVGLDTVVSRTVTDFSPNLFFRYRFDKQTQLRIRYNCSTSQPSMIDVLPIRDETNPMWITEGNPGLRSSFTNNVNIDFQTYNAEKQRGMYWGTFFVNTFNSISNKITYDDKTGSIVSRPENINGNWHIHSHLGMNSPFRDERFSIDSHTGVGMNNSVGYVRTDGDSDSRKNKTVSYSIYEWLNLGFRNDDIELRLYGNINYSRAKNKLISSGNTEFFRYSYGFNGLVHLPYGFTVSTDIERVVRTGYEDDSFNTDEILWDAQLSYAFLKEKKATLSFEINDILHEKSIVTRDITATSRSESRRDNVFFSYWMVHFIYKFNIFGI